MSEKIVQGLLVYTPATTLPAGNTVQGLFVANTIVSMGSVETIVGESFVVDISGFIATAVGETFERAPNHSKRLFPTVSRRLFPRT